MGIELATKFLSHVDELFATESKKSLLTNNDFTWDGTSTIKVYRVTTSTMNDYGRSGPSMGNWSRYGAVEGLEATTQAMTLRKDRSFTFAIDKLDKDETTQALQAATALARQLREGGRHMDLQANVRQCRAQAHGVDTFSHKYLH